MKFRFSFKTLLAAITLAAIALTVFRTRLESSRRQRDAVADLTAAGVHIKYDYENDSTLGALDPFNTTVNANATNASLTIKINSLRLWIGRQFGRDFVADIKEVRFIRPRSANVIARLRDLRRIETLTLMVSRDFEVLQADAWQELVKCQSVKQLTLHHDRDHPGRGLAGLSMMQQLRSLSISGGNFDAADAQEVAQLTNLRQLSLHPIYMPLAPLVALRRLEQFDFNGASFDDEHLVVLKELPRIKSLSISLDQADVSGTTFERLAGLKELKKLSLTRTLADDAALEKLRPLMQLEELHLAGSQVSDTGLKNLSAFKNLRELGLGNVPITDEGIASIVASRNLEKLVLSHAEATDAGLKRLGTLKKLQELWLGDEVSPSVIAEIQKLLPACRIVQPGLLLRAARGNTQIKSLPTDPTTTEMQP